MIIKAKKVSSVIRRVLCSGFTALIMVIYSEDLASCQKSSYQRTLGVTQKPTAHDTQMASQGMLMKISKSASATLAIDVTLINDTTSNFSYLSGDSHFNGFRFQIVNQQGKSLPISESGSPVFCAPGRVNFGSLTVLTPGQKTTVTIPIAQFYDMTLPGVYIIRAFGPHPLAEDDFMERGRTSTGKVVTSIHKGVFLKEFRNLQSNQLILMSSGENFIESPYRKILSSTSPKP